VGTIEWSKKEAGKRALKISFTLVFSFTIGRKRGGEEEGKGKKKDIFVSSRHVHLIGRVAGRRSISLGEEKGDCCVPPLYSFSEVKRKEGKKEGVALNGHAAAAPSDSN